MTRYEKLIVSAYTGVLMVEMSDFHKWVEEFLGYPVWTPEFATGDFWMRLHEKTRDEFFRICKEGSND